MKTTLTVEESARLIELGVDPKMASTTCINFNGTYAYVSGEESGTVRDCVSSRYYTEERPCFSIADLLSILPKEIEYNNARISLQMYQHLAGYWIASYVKYSGNELIHQKPLCAEKELIDALNSLLIWVLENNLNQEKQ